MPPTNVKEIEIILNTLKSTASGYDDVSPKILKLSSTLISIPLAHIINLSLKTEYFRDKLKVAKVIPMYKSGDKKIVNNYRPMSILPSFSKYLRK